MSLSENALKVFTQVVRAQKSYTLTLIVTIITQIRRLFRSVNNGGKKYMTNDGNNKSRRQGKRLVREGLVRLRASQERCQSKYDLWIRQERDRPAPRRRTDSTYRCRRSRRSGPCSWRKRPAG